jgi:uncharacterized membrane protein
MAVVKLNKHVMGAVAVAFVWALSVPAVQANPWAGYLVREANRQGGNDGQRGVQQGAERRQSLQRNDGREAQRPQRLSPEERTQLRRDIKDAGREIYPARRR